MRTHEASQRAALASELCQSTKPPIPANAPPRDSANPQSNVLAVVQERGEPNYNRPLDPAIAPPRVSANPKSEIRNPKSPFFFFIADSRALR
jgi:hypothetical protein